MSSGKGARVSIPDSVTEIIQNIHEATAAPKDEIYATLKECSMDPNETVQKLLSQDTFHEVKSKRDKRKENSSNKEAVESRWKSGQGRGGRGGRGNYSSRYMSNDTSGRNSSVGKENTSNQASKKSTGLILSSAHQEPKRNEPAAATRTASVIANGPSAIVAKGMKPQISVSGGAAPHEHLDIVKENSSDNSSAETRVTSPGAHFSSSDPVLVPSHDSRMPGAAGTIKREVGCQQKPAEQITAFPAEGKTIAATLEVGNPSTEGYIVPSKSVGVGKNQQSDTTVRPSSAHGGSSGVRPSSNHNNRSQQVVGPPKCSTKEWKPKSTNPSFVQGSSMSSQSEVSAAMEANTQSRPEMDDFDSKETSTKLQRILENLHISENQHVIIPDHLHVPGAEKVSFCFGSFDAISLDTSFKNASDDNNPATSLETCQRVEEMAEQTSSLENVLAMAEEGSHHDHPQSPEDTTETLSQGEHDVPSAGTQEYGESKQESDLPQGSHQYPMIHTSPNYSFGLMPTVMGSRLPPFEGSESQAREVSHVPSFVVPQSFDPTSYYAQFDGRISPFHAAGVAKVLPPQTSQAVSEGGNSTVMPTAAPNAFVTQPAAVVMPNSIAVTQQSVPLFRQPFGIPFPHYPPNYMPYGPYFSPFFVPHFNQSLSNSAYPQQPQAGNVYPAPPGPSPKFSFPQYKAGTGSGNSTNVGVASSYGPYGPSVSTAGNSTTNEDLTTQQFKETNVYIAGQQLSEGSGLWITPPGRDMSGVQANSFYNIPSQGQMAFPQPQPGHDPFTGMYHTAQAASAATGHPLRQHSQTLASAVDIAGPASNVYQQPPHSQVTWAQQ